MYTWVSTDLKTSFVLITYTQWCSTFGHGPGDPGPILSLFVTLCFLSRLIRVATLNKGAHP